MVFRTLLLLLGFLPFLSMVNSAGNGEHHSITIAPLDVNGRPPSNPSSSTEKAIISPSPSEERAEGPTSDRTTNSEEESSPSNFVQLLTICDPIVEERAPLYNRTSPTFNSNWIGYFDHCGREMKTQAKKNSKAAQLLQSLYYTIHWFQGLFSYAKSLPETNTGVMDDSTTQNTQRLVIVLEDKLNDDNEEINTFIHTQVQEYYRIQERKRKEELPAHYVISHEKNSELYGLRDKPFEIYSIKRNEKLISQVRSFERYSSGSDISTSSGGKSSPSGFLQLMDICYSILPESDRKLITTLSIMDGHQTDYLYKCKSEIDRQGESDSHKAELFDSLCSSLYFILGSLNDHTHFKSKSLSFFTAKVTKRWDNYLKDMFESKYKEFDTSIKLQVSEYYQIKKRQDANESPEHYTKHLVKSRRLLWNSPHKFSFYSFVVNGNTITEVRFPHLSSSPPSSPPSSPSSFPSSSLYSYLSTLFTPI